MSDGDGKNGLMDSGAPSRFGFDEPTPAESASSTVPAVDDEGPVVQGWNAAGLIGLAVAVACSLFVFIQMRPDLLFSNTTPAGGDMGAHVWGPAFLRDNLLGQARLTGWTPDWYAGFPAYHFYMVVPSLAIVAVNAGFQPFLSIPLAILVIGGGFWLTRASKRQLFYRIAIVVIALLLLSVPYGIAFKLVSVSGLVTFPLAAWALGRLARAPEPVPAFLSIASLFFLFDTNFTIYGGNIASTLAGEFAFSISLSFGLLAIGLSIRGMDDKSWRARSAIAISLIALTHLIPVFFAIIALAAVVVAGRNVPRLWPVAAAIALSLIPIALADGTAGTVTLLAILAAIVTFGAVILAEPEVRARAGWLLIVGPTGALLSGFWLLPFYLREPFFNDMGWERLDEVGPAMLTVPMKIGLPLAAVGVVAALATRERVGLVFMTTGAVFAAGVANLGEGPLWNARLLPFFYLSIYFMAAIGGAFVVRFAAMAMTERFDRPDQRIIVSASLAGLMAGLIAVGIPLRILPFSSSNDDGSYQWLAFTSHAASFLPGWTAWNYSGYEAKPSYREYRNVVMTMDGLGQSSGCGRAMWEYSPNLDRYGTPMALMLLPHWTDGCIGSMEGLYFESSASTPFHFLNQSMLSQEPSRAQRDLPYQSFDIDRGIGQLQVTGVRYYMAQTDESIEAARQHPDLIEMAEAQPFVIFEVAGSNLVEALSYEPLVVSGRTEEQATEVANRFDLGWINQAVSVYNDPNGFQALPAEDGPEEWQRVASLLPTDGEPVEPAVVTDIRADNSSISFTVDQVGTPVLVKASYFPNWDANGAEGPWRIGPNLMVVVPTETSVSLNYGRTSVDWLGVLATLAGLCSVFGLVTFDRRRREGIAMADDERDEAGTNRDLAAVGVVQPRTAAANLAIESPTIRLERPLPGSSSSPLVEVGDREAEPMTATDPALESANGATDLDSRAELAEVPPRGDGSGRSGDQTKGPESPTEQGPAEPEAEEGESPAFLVDAKLSTEVGRDIRPAS